MATTPNTKSKATAPAVAPTNNRAATAQKVKAMREVKLLSWRAIGNELGFSPKTARAMYQDAVGKDQHHGLLPGKGGRLPAGFVATDVSAVKAPGSAAWVPRPEGTPGTPGTKGGAVAPAPAPAPAPVKAPRSRKPKALKA